MDLTKYIKERGKGYAFNVEINGVQFRKQSLDYNKLLEYIEQNRIEIEQLFVAKNDWKEGKKLRMREKDKRYREANKEKVKQRHKNYREANKEKIKERKKLYREINKDKIAQRTREYRKDNKDKIAEIKRKYNKANKYELMRKRLIKKETTKKLYSFCSDCNKIFILLEYCIDENKELFCVERKHVCDGNLVEVIRTIKYGDDDWSKVVY